MSEQLPGIGDNVDVSYFETETARLKQDYDYLAVQVAEQTTECSGISVINDQPTKDVVTAHIKKMRETYKRILGVHEAEKAPHLERGRANDGFFFALMDKLGRRDKKAKPGEADRLNQLLTDYDVRVLAEEEEKRRKAAAEAAAAAAAAEADRLRKEQEAEDARLAAERARKPDTTAAKAAVAEAKEAEASAARVEETVAAARAEEAYINSLATPADIMRQRSTVGVTSGMASEKFREITDRNTLDLEKLRPYLAVAALETALNKYAESVGYSNDESVQIKGARFGKRPKSRVY
jgi:hypothetical protein